jgi:hypothetical protein
VPILAKQAIERASLIENSQIFVTIFGSIAIGKLGIASACPTGTHPICYTVSGQGVIIPADIPNTIKAYA